MSSLYYYQRNIRSHHSLIRFRVTFRLYQMDCFDRTLIVRAFGLLVQLQGTIVRTGIKTIKKIPL